MKSVDADGMKKEFTWERCYREAMLELNPVELGPKIRLAISALQLRSSELMLSRDSERAREWQAIEDALNNLRVIERFELNPAMERDNRNSSANRVA